MPVERSAGAIIFHEFKNKREYLLLQHQAIESGRVINATVGHWSFAKGHIEKGETTDETIRREVREETGITKIEFISGFKQTIRYFLNYNGEKRLKFVVFFLAHAAEKKVIISLEHQGFVWLPYEQAYKTITYASDKKVLKAAETFLSK